LNNRDFSVETGEAIMGVKLARKKAPTKRFVLTDYPLQVRPVWERLWRIFSTDYFSGETFLTGYDMNNMIIELWRELFPTEAASTAIDGELGQPLPYEIKGVNIPGVSAKC
jgi:hypothetical protein